jgi:hypothetical protein
VAPIHPATLLVVFSSSSPLLIQLRQLLQELHQPIQKAMLVYCDNISAVYLFINLIQYQRTKHIEIDLHLVRDKVVVGTVRVLHVTTTLQYADIVTKGLPSSVFYEFWSNLNVRSTAASTAGSVSGKNRLHSNCKFRSWRSCLNWLLKSTHSMYSCTFLSSG